MNDPIKINFILPFKARRPAGGFRVMYEYANRLSRLGYAVHLTYPVHTPFMNYRLPYIARRILSMVEGFGKDRWFDFDPAITMAYVPEVKDVYIPDADIVIATWWATVQEMGKLSLRKGKKINLIQGYENWEGHEDLLLKTYDMPDTVNVVISSFLKNIVEQHTDNEVIQIENGVDKDVFNITQPIERRKPTTVVMSYSIQEIKGSKDGIEALKLVKEQIPELTVELFGVCPHPEGLPEWMSFTRNPANLPEMYNRNAILLSTSLTEGFGLVCVEGMFCGCALVCTDIDGHREYAFDGDTALLAAPQDAKKMAEHICRLIRNNEERIAIAKRGNAFAQRYSWNNAIARMDEVIKKRLV